MSPRNPTRRAASVNFERAGIQVDNVTPRAHFTIAGEAELETMLDSPSGRSDLPENMKCSTMAIHVARHRWWNEMNPLSKTLDVVCSQEASDCQACDLGIAVPGAVLGDDESTVVVDADEVAGAAVDLVVGVFLSLRIITTPIHIIKGYQQTRTLSVSTNEPGFLTEYISLNFWRSLWQAPAAWHRGSISPIASLHELILEARQISKGESRFQHLLDDARLGESPFHRSTETVVSLVDFQRPDVQVDNVSPRAPKAFAGEVEFVDVFDWAGGGGDGLDADETVLVIFVVVGWWLDEVDFLEQALDVAFND